MKTKISLMMLLLAAWLLVGCEPINEPTTEEGGTTTVDDSNIASVNKVTNFYGTIYELILKDGNRMYFGIKNDSEVRMGNWKYFYDGSEYEYEKYAAYEYKGDLVIPEKITLEGKEYTVTELYDMSQSGSSFKSASSNDYRFWEETYKTPNTTLLSVVIPNTIKKMISGCFGGCTSLKSVTFEKGSPIKELVGSCFLGCSSLEDVVLPENLATIDYQTFAFCTSLKTITLPKSVTTIEDRAFYGCTTLENINLENVEVIEGGYGTFTGCVSLKTINLMNVRKIVDYAFYKCTSLENVRLDNIEILGGNAFDSCTSLKHIELPSIEYLGVSVEEEKDKSWWYSGDAFNDCHSLETIILGSSLLYTSYSLFEGCNSLKEVYCYAINPPMDRDWEEGYSDYREFVGDFVLHVPASSIEAYKETAWGTIYGVGERTIVAIEE